MTILCATRFTEESSFAVDVAAQLARAHREPLWLVHSLPTGTIAFWGERLAAAARATLEHEAKRITSQGIEVHTEVVYGKLEEAIAACCKAKNATLLVVGDTARPLGKVMAGTLDKLAYAVEAPLLVVRDPRPFGAWVKGTRPLKVMLALDNTSSSALARDWIFRLAAYGPIELVASRIWWPLEEYEHRKLPVPPPEDGHLALAQLMKKETDAALAAMPKNVKASIHLEMGSTHIADQMMELANSEQVDLVVIGTHRRRALGRLRSVSHQVVARAPMAVACIPASTAVPDLTTAPRFSSALVATDFSEAANRAVSCAIGLVGHGTVHVVHVTPEPFSPEQEKGLLKRLTEVLPPDAERGGARVMVHVFHGEVVAKLLEANEALGADVVCLGLRAESLTRNTVAHQVLARANKPVLFAPVVRA